MDSLNLLAYLITLGNVQSMETSGSPVENLSVKLGDLHSLKSDLLSIPGINLYNFRDTGYYRHGNTGQYLSKNLRDFIYEGVGDPSEEGVILKIIFNNKTPTVKPDDSTLSLLLHREPVDDVAKGQLIDYLDNKHARRQRSLVDMLRT